MIKIERIQWDNHFYVLCDYSNIDSFYYDLIDNWYDCTHIGACPTPTQVKYWYEYEFLFTFIKE